MSQERPGLERRDGLGLEKDYEVLEAGDGEEGLQIALKHDIDLVFSDIRMPKLDGMTFLEKLE
ncbi:MAG: response regulator, partial [Candidatus Omnitrophota bacterium]